MATDVTDGRLKHLAVFITLLSAVALLSTAYNASVVLPAKMQLCALHAWGVRGEARWLKTRPVA